MEITNKEVQESQIQQKQKEVKSSQKINYQKLPANLTEFKDKVKYICDLLLMPEVTPIKKHIQSIFCQYKTDYKQTLIVSENIIKDFLQSEQFNKQVIQFDNIICLIKLYNLLISIYVEIYQKDIQCSKSELADNQQNEESIGKQLESPSYIPQINFVLEVMSSMAKISNNYQKENLKKNGYIINFMHQKALIELFNVFINFVGRLINHPAMEIKNCIQTLQLCEEYINDSSTQKDILAQCSILYWQFIKIEYQKLNIKTNDITLLILNMQQKFGLSELIKGQIPNLSIGEQKLDLQLGITEMAKTRGFTLTFDSEMDFEQVMQNSQTQYGSFLDYIIVNCEKNEGLSKVFSFQTLEGLLSKLHQINNEDWLRKVLLLAFHHLEQPLSAVQTSCQNCLKRLLQICNQQQIKSIINSLNDMSKNNIKSKFVALNIIIDYIDPIKFLEENPNIMKEIIESSIDTINIGKYVLNFLETLLRITKTKLSEKQWFDIWIKDYLESLISNNEELRNSVSNYVTPIVIKINRNSLSYILSLLMSNENTINYDKNIALESLFTLIKVARQNKMLEISDEFKELRLEKQCQQALHDIDPTLPEFKISHQDILKLLMSDNYKMCLDCIQIVSLEMKSSEKVLNFEYEMCLQFIKNCLRTTFPEHRQNYIKSIKSFFIRLRTVNDKDIKKCVQNGQINESVSQLVNFLKQIILHIEENLYLDKPIEGAQPFFEVLKILFDLFGDFEFRAKASQSFNPCYLLKLAKLTESRSLFYFLLNSLKSTWSLIRQLSFDILIRYPPDYEMFCDTNFVNNILLKSAMDYSVNAKAMMAECSAYLLKLIFVKSIKHVSFIQQDQSLLNIRQMQLQYLNHFLSLINQRLSNFFQSLIKEGKSECLIHGILSFFKHLFEDFKINRDELSLVEFKQWRQFFNDLLQTCLKISNATSSLLSNNGLLTESEDNTNGNTTDLQVDCRGHPINLEANSSDLVGDYENLILVGVWLAVKENGLTFLNALHWLELPQNENDDTKFIIHQDIINLSQNFLGMLFQFKHRGAIEKAAECLMLLCQKLFQSTSKTFQDLPLQLLKQALDKITKESLSTILRRSAGIPPTILSILRAEPAQNEPILLNLTLEFLINLAQKADKDDTKVHALNILRYIFQDALLKHDIKKYITPAMILSTESFSSNSWSIRNSALMAFTSLTKRILNTLHIQDQRLTNTKGLSTWEFITRYQELSDYFKGKLKECLQNTKCQKEEKEKQDLVIFSIMLLLSRLVPSFKYIEQQKLEYCQNTQNQNEISDNNIQLKDESSISQFNENQIKQRLSREQVLIEYVDLIKQYSSNSTYFVRKISAQSLLTLTKFEQYVPIIQQGFQDFKQSINNNVNFKLKQNEAHGLMIRIYVFLVSYFQLRNSLVPYQQLSYTLDKINNKQKEEEILIQCFKDFEDNFESYQNKYSNVIIGLFVKAKVLMLRNIEINIINDKEDIQKYEQRLQQLISKNNGKLNSQDQILLKQLLKIIQLLYFNCKDQENYENNIYLFFKDTIIIKILPNYTDLSFKILKSFKQMLSNNIKRFNQQFSENMSNYLMTEILPSLLQMNELQCKLIESILKLGYFFIKSNPNQCNQSLCQLVQQMIHKFKINPNIISVLIKFYTVLIRHQIQNKTVQIEHIFQLSEMIYKYSSMDQKEQVRISAAKSLGFLIPYFKFSSSDCIFIQSNQAFSGVLNLLKSLILLLNDESSCIRNHLINSGISYILQSKKYTINQQHISQQQIVQEESNQLVLQLNDQIIVEELFNDITQQIIALNNKDLIEQYMNNYLLKEYLFKDEYRDHVSKNYDDKIFFYEPINKFYDLLWIKRIAFSAYVKYVNTIIEQKEQTHKVIIDEKYKNQIDIVNKINTFYNDQHLMKQTSQQYEEIIQNIIMNLLYLKLEQKQSNLFSENKFIDKYMTTLIKQ